MPNLETKENLDQVIAQIKNMRSYIGEFGKNADPEITKSESRLTQSVFGKLLIKDMNKEPFSKIEKEFFDEERVKEKGKQVSTNGHSPSALALSTAQTSLFKS